jgi:uncharacterized membrane protein YkoI
MAWLVLGLTLILAAAPSAIGSAWANDTANTLARTAQCRSATNAPADVLPFSEVRRRIGDDIVRAVLCQDGAAWIYRVTTVAASGAVRTLLFDARTGAAIKP